MQFLITPSTVVILNPYPVNHKQLEKAFEYCCEQWRYWSQKGWEPLSVLQYTALVSERQCKYIPVSMATVNNNNIIFSQVKSITSKKAAINQLFNLYWHKETSKNKACFLIHL